MPYLATIAPFGFTEFNLPSWLALYRDLGCAACQFYRNLDHPPAPSEARKLAEDLGMPIDSVHGMFGPHLDPSSLDESVRRATVEAYRREGDLALELGGPMVVVHPSPAISGTARHGAARLDRLRRSMTDLAETGRRLGVTYLFENVTDSHCFGYDPVQVAQMVREMDQPNVRMCFDIGHAHMSGHGATALRQCLDVVAYLHVHDNDGLTDAHMLPGQGTITWEQMGNVVTDVPAQTPAMLEVFESEKNLAAMINDNLTAHLRAWLGLDVGEA